MEEGENLGAKEELLEIGRNIQNNPIDIFFKITENFSIIEINPEGSRKVLYTISLNEEDMKELAFRLSFR